MRLAADRDLIAAEWTNGYALTFEFVVPKLIESSERRGSLIYGVVDTHIALLAEHGDSLILRKTDSATNQHVRLLASRCVEAISDDTRYGQALDELDFWLRSDGNRRNPGTTADLIAAALFVGLYNGELKLPERLA
jgi:triphosphoribosyl-dephospho-CoA synthase